MIELVALAIFGVPIIVVGGLFYFAFRTGGWFNRTKAASATNDKLTPLGHVIYSLVFLLVIGGVSLEHTASDTPLGRFMSDDTNQLLYAWGCYLSLALTVTACEVTGHRTLK